LIRGERLTEILKQEQCKPLPVEKQVLIIFAGINGYLNDQPLSAIKTFESRLYLFMDETHPELLQQIRSKGTLDEALETSLHSAIGEFKTIFMAQQAMESAVTNPARA